MFGNPQDIVTMIAAATVLFGAGGVAVRSAMTRPHAAAAPDPKAPPAEPPE